MRSVVIYANFFSLLYLFTDKLETVGKPNELYFHTVNTRENDTIVLGVIYNKTVAGLPKCYFREQQIAITYGAPPEATLEYVNY